MLDAALITRHLRAKASSHLLVAAALYFKVFEELNEQPLSLKVLQNRLQLEDRPAMVLFPALCAMGLLEFNAEEKLVITEYGKYLTLTNTVNLVGYVGLEKDDPGVVHLVRWMKNDGPEDVAHGLSYVKDEKAASPMDDPETARFFTMALAGRARMLSPLVAGEISKHPGMLLDVGAGTGYYTYEWLVANPYSSAIIFDRAEVLKVAEGLLLEFCKEGIHDVDAIRRRLTFMPGDMLTDELPQADILLAASVFHDWPVDTCQMLANKFAEAIRPGGELWVHDAFLNDTLDGPIAVTDYSTMLFLGTKGRAYSRKECRQWLSNAGLVTKPENIATALDYGLISALKPI